jgi:D-psicose/D-tagatose/L-ribulose 3-epimerase
MSELRYAVHAYAWTTRWGDQSLELIDRAKRLGFDAIEIPLMELDGIYPLKIKERCEAAGLGVCTSTVLSDETDITAEEAEARLRGVAYLEECVRTTAAMGGTVFSGVIYSALGGRIDAMPDERYYMRAATCLRQVARTAQGFGVTIGLEPVNRYETFLVNTCEQALRLREMIGEPNVGIHPDTYHMNIEENDFCEAMRKAAPHICHVHVSESHRGTPGTGTVDWHGVFRALVESGYAGFVGMESFIDITDSLRAATCVWRRLAPSSTELLVEGLRFLKGVEARARGAQG